MVTLSVHLSVHLFLYTTTTNEISKHRQIETIRTSEEKEGRRGEIRVRVFERKKMEGLRVATFTTMAVLVLLVTLVFPAIANAQSPEPSMAPSPSNDGVAIDQGIAYVLMVAALVLTYIMH